MARRLIILSLLGLTLALGDIPHPVPDPWGGVDLMRESPPTEWLDDTAARILKVIKLTLKNNEKAVQAYLDYENKTAKTTSEKLKLREEFLEVLIKQQATSQEHNESHK
jgi:hypothetical protein